MPIRPIDMLSMPNRSQEASQVHHAENQKLMHAQEQMGVQYNNTVRKEGQQTVKMSKSENNEYRYKDGRNGGADSRKKQNNRKKQQEETEKENIKKSNFDILI